MSQQISWIHFGDLHIDAPEDQNYRDFLTLIREANLYMEKGIDFALLPGDNADDGEEGQYQLVKKAVDECCFSVFSIAGDHDVALGDLSLFRRYLTDPPYRSVVLNGYRLLFLNSVAHWHPPVFGLGETQMNWLSVELQAAQNAGEGVAVFLHAYPSEHGSDAGLLRQLLRQSRVLVVEMGHTHYNELANDGQIIYGTTRSTGQIEEGPAGFSVTTLDDGVVSWKFKPIGEWPLVMVTSPVDERLITDPLNACQVVRGSVQVRARVWGSLVQGVTLSVDHGAPISMEQVDRFTWCAEWDAGQMANGSHLLQVRAEESNGQVGYDSISVLVLGDGKYHRPSRSELDSENTIGAWTQKHILGTQLGPNKNGHPWPSRRERTGAAR